MSKIINITEENFEGEVLKSAMPVVLDFTAEWCGYCKLMMPDFEKVSDEYGEKAVFGVVNVDEQKKFAIANKVVSIPALLFYKNGELAERVVGAINAEQLKGKLDALM